MKNVFTTVLKKELALIITKDNLNATLKQLSDFITTFYLRKKIVGYIAIILAIIALPFYKYTSKVIPNIMQKTFPNDLAFIVYCGILLLIVGIPLITWYNMDNNYKKNKYNVLQLLNYSVQNYFDNDATELKLAINFKNNKQNLKSGTKNLYDYVHLKTSINNVNYETTISESSGMAYNQNAYQPNKYRSPKSMSYHLHLITNCTLQKTHYQKKEGIEPYQNISIGFNETPENYCYEFKTYCKVESNTTNLVTAPAVKNYFDYMYLTVALLKS